MLQNFVNAFIELIVVYYFSLFFNYSLGGVSIFLQGGENFNASVRTLKVLAYSTTGWPSSIDDEIDH